jgi:hypothetical protein
MKDAFPVTRPSEPIKNKRRLECLLRDSMTASKGKPHRAHKHRLFVGRDYEAIHYPLGNMAAGTLAVISYRHRRGPTSARSRNDPARTGFRLARATPDES